LYTLYFKIFASQLETKIKGQKYQSTPALTMDEFMFRLEKD